MKNVLVLRVVVLVVAAVALSACNLFFGPEDEQAEARLPGDRGEMRLTFSPDTEVFTTRSAVSSLAFDESQLAEQLVIDEYEITFDPAEGVEAEGFGVNVEVSESDETEYLQTGLMPGEWTITVIALEEKEGGTKEQIGEAEGGSFTVEIEPGRTATPDTVSVVPMVGPGSIDLTLTWPSGVTQDPTIFSKVRNRDDNETIEILDWNIDGTEATVSFELDADYYTLVVQLYDGDYDNSGVRLWGDAFPVRIVADRDRVATGALELDDLDATGELDITVGADMQNPFSVEISADPEDDPIVIGTDLVLTVDDPDPVANGSLSYRWYLDGQRIAGEDSHVLTHAAQEEGRYRIRVIVDNTVALSSASFNFSVVPPENNGD